VEGVVERDAYAFAVYALEESFSRTREVRNGEANAITSILSDIFLGEEEGQATCPCQQDRREACRRSPGCGVAS